MENNVITDLEVFLQDNKDSEGRLVISLGKDVIHYSKQSDLETIMNRLYGLMKSLSEEPQNTIKRYVDFNEQGNPVFIPFNVLKNCTLRVEAMKSENLVH